MTSVAVVGPGRMGLALTEALARSRQLTEVVVFGRRPEPPRHPAFGLDGVRYVYGLQAPAPDCMAVLLAVPDEALPEVAHHMAAQGAAPERCAAFHLSGGLPSDVLAPLHASGYHVGVFHPWILASRSSSGATRLAGARIGVTASSDGFRAARDLASLVGAEVLEIPAARRPLTHAVVSMAESYLPVLVSQALPLLDRVGLAPDEAVEALAPLLRSVLAEMEEEGAAATLRAVAERVDAEALDTHLRTLEGEERLLYEWLRQLVARRSAAGEDSGSAEFETASRN